MLDVRFGSSVEYRFELFENPHALRTVALPPKIAEGYPRYTAADVDSTTVGGEPWFADMLKDEEWLRDPSKRALEEPLRVIAELEEHRAGDHTDGAK